MRFGTAPGRFFAVGAQSWKPLAANTAGNVYQYNHSFYNPVITPPQGYNVADAETYINESLVNFCTGVIPPSEYPAFLEALKTTYHYQSFIDAAAQQLEEAGYLNEREQGETGGPF